MRTSGTATLPANTSGRADDEAATGGARVAGEAVWMRSASPPSPSSATSMPSVSHARAASSTGWPTGGCTSPSRTAGRRARSSPGRRWFVTVPVRRGGILALLAPIPATITFRARAMVHPAGSLDIGAVSKELVKLVPEARKEGSCVIELVPEGRFLTYGNRRVADGHGQPGARACPRAGWVGERRSIVRLLIAVSSKHGSTREIADAIGETLSQAGVEVEVADANDVRTVTPSTPSSSEARSTGAAGWGPRATSSAAPPMHCARAPCGCSRAGHSGRASSIRPMPPKARSSSGSSGPGITGSFQARRTSRSSASSSGGWSRWSRSRGGSPRLAGHPRMGGINCQGARDGPGRRRLTAAVSRVAAICTERTPPAPLSVGLHADGR